MNAHTITTAEQTAHILASHGPMLSALKGAQSALRKALPFCPPESEAHYVGEWLDEVTAAIQAAEAWGM